MFESLLSGEAGVLLRDLEDNPDRYAQLPGLDVLLGGVASGARKLSELEEQDRRMLDQATVEYATAPRTPELVEGRAQLERQVKRVLTQAVEPRPPEPGDVPDSDMPAFWWLQ